MNEAIRPVNDASSSAKRLRDGDNITCGGCKVPIGDDRECFSLENDGSNNSGPCGHFICGGCFAAAVANKGCFLGMLCPSASCRYISTSWAHHPSSDDRGIRPDPTIHKAIQPNTLNDRINHPTQFYLNQQEQYKKAHTLLTLTCYKPDNATKSTSVQVEIPTNSDHITDEIKKGIEGVGQYLHPLLVEKPKKVPSSFNVYESIEGLESKTDSALRHLVHGIAIGEPLANTQQNAVEKETKQIYQKELNKTLVAAEMIQSAKGARRSSALKNLITNQLFVSGANTATVAMMCQLGLSKSRNFMDLAAQNAVIDKIQSGYDITGSRWDMIVLLYDNLGAKGKPIITNGAQIARGYVQFTTMVLKRISYKSLIKWGIYPNPNHEDPSNAPPLASTVGRDWVEEQEHYNFRLEQSDGNILLTTIVLPHLNSILALLECGDLPDYNGALRWLESNQSVEFEVEVTRRVDSRQTIEEATEENAVDHDIGQSLLNYEELGDIDDLDDHATGPPRTIFEANGFVPDIPIQEDLNCISTVQNISRYLHGISERMLADENDEMNDVWANCSEPPEPIMKQTGPALLGDGSPTFAALKLKYTKLKDINLWAIFGGFHLLLEAHRKRGSMFGMTHLRSIFHGWRKSEKQKAWVLNPGDPNQVDDESVPMYYAAYAAAAIALIERRREDSSIPDEEVNKISPTDVYQYTLQVEKEKPAARVVLLDLRTLEVIFLLHHAEEKGNAKLFVCAMKFLLVLFAVTHATKYVFMLVKFMIWWRCGSEAEKIIFEKGLMVQYTVSKKTVFSDRMFEWIQRMLRGNVGKHFTQGFDKRLAQSTLQLDDKSLFKYVANAENKRAPNNTKDPTNSVQFGKIYCETLKYFIEKQIWKLNGDKTLDSLSRTNGTTHIHINPEVLRIPDIGEERVQSYMRTYENADGSDTNGERSDTVVNLSTIQPTSEKRTTQDNIHRERLNSTNATTVTNSYSKNELEQEYSKLQTEFNNNADIGQPFPVLSGTNKPDYALAICSARQILSVHDTNWKESRLTAFNNRLAARDSTERSELDQEYSQICGGVFVNLGSNSANGQSIRSTYSTAKYDFSNLSLVQPSNDTGDADDDVPMDGNGDGDGDGGGSGGDANNNSTGWLLPADTLTGLSSIFSAP